MEEAVKRIKIKGSTSIKVDYFGGCFNVKGIFYCVQNISSFKSTEYGRIDIEKNSLEAMF